MRGNLRGYAPRSSLAVPHPYPSGLLSSPQTPISPIWMESWKANGWPEEGRRDWLKAGNPNPTHSATARWTEDLLRQGKIDIDHWFWCFNFVIWIKSSNLNVKSLITWRHWAVELPCPQILVSRKGTQKEREREQEIFHWSRRREISLNGSIKRCMHNQLRSFMVPSSSLDRSVSDSPQGQGSNNSTNAVGKIFRPLKMVTIPQPFRAVLVHTSKPYRL